MRNQTIDIVKGLGILLVVFGHNWLVIHNKGELFRVIFSFHMPLFFLISGIFLKAQGRFGAFAVSKADSLLKPYWVVLIALGLLKVAAGGAFWPYFLGVLYGAGDTILWIPLWFLPHLFVVLLCVWSVLVVASKTEFEQYWLWLAVFIFLAVGYVVIGRFSEGVLPTYMSATFLGAEAVRGLPFSIDLIFLSAAFVLLGYLFRNQIGAMNFHFGHFLLALIIFSTLHYLFDETIDFNLRLYGQFFIATLQALAGIYLVVSAAAFLSRYKWIGQVLAYVGSGSLFILIFHSFFQGKIFALMSRFLSNDYLSSLVSFGVGVIMPLFILEVVRRQKILAALLLPLKKSVRLNSLHTVKN